MECIKSDDLKGWLVECGMHSCRFGGTGSRVKWYDTWLFIGLNGFWESWSIALRKGV